MNLEEEKNSLLLCKPDTGGCIVIEASESGVYVVPKNDGICYAT